MRRLRRRLGQSAWAALLILLAGTASAQNDEVPPSGRVVGGDAEAGRWLIAAVGCGACHVIPGVSGARGIVGPNLEGFGARKLIGGQIPNEPTWLARWVRDAPALIPETGMPEMPLTESQARDVAAYLSQLR